MTAVPTVTTPDITTYVDQQFFIEPLGGPQGVLNYLDRFPDNVYNKSPDSHFVRFMYALLGPAGGGWLRKNYLQARLIFEDHGIELSNLEDFYGNPFDFPRILDEVYTEDPGGLLTRDQWNAIKVKDAQYRGRIMDFLAAIRAGNTPLGMKLAARSGLGHDVEIIENYQYLYDQHSDDPLGLPYYGKTSLLEEMIVLPRQELPKKTFYDLIIADTTVTSGYLQLKVNGQVTANINYNGTADDVLVALEDLGEIGNGNIASSGGPLPTNPVRISYTGALSYIDSPDITVASETIAGDVFVNKTTEIINSATDVAAISPADQHALKVAMERLKPVPTIITTNLGSGNVSQVPYNSVFGSSAFVEVIRYVTGNNDVRWPTLDNRHWIEASREHEAPRAQSIGQQHYQGFHNVITINAYTEQALDDPDYLTDNWETVHNSYVDSHVGTFNKLQQFLYPILESQVPNDFVYGPSLALPQYAEPVSVSVTNDHTYINNIYPLDYQNAPGVQIVPASASKFWASAERPVGTDYLEIDLGRVQAINYISMEVTQKPFDISVSFDILDQGPSRIFTSAFFDRNRNSITSVGYTPVAVNPWQYITLNVETARESMIYARYLRIAFSRRSDPASPFVNSDQTITPYSIEVRNLRIGRNTI